MNISKYIGILLLFLLAIFVTLIFLYFYITFGIKLTYLFLKEYTKINEYEQNNLIDILCITSLFFPILIIIFFIIELINIDK